MSDPVEKVYNGRWVTLAMICEHAKKHRSSVVRALKAAGVQTERIAGCKGVRLREREANRFLLRQWPEAGPLPMPAQGGTP